MFRVIYSETDQSVVRVPIDPITGSPVLLGGTVSVAFYDKREGEGQESVGTATVSQDATSSILTANSGFSQPDPTMVSVIPSSVREGHTYLIEGAGQSELFQVRRVTTTAVYAAHGLRGNYAIADVARVRGIEVEATFPDLTADTDAVENGGGPYVVTWTYAHDGSTVVLADTAYLDRFSLAPPIDETYVLMANPSMGDRVRSRGSIAQAIAVAWQDYLAEVESSGRDPSLLIPSNGAKVALRHQALAYLFEWVSGGDTDDAAATSHHQRYDAIMRNILTGEAPKGTVEISRNTGEAVTPDTGFEFIRRS
ncbi:MAG: hypothetical protein ACRBBM_17450 [Pseudomonadaceae bacterium]